MNKHPILPKCKRLYYIASYSQGKGKKKVARRAVFKKTWCINEKEIYKTTKGYQSKL